MNYIHNQPLRIRIRYRNFDLDFVYNFSITYPERLVMNVNKCKPLIYRRVPRSPLRWVFLHTYCIGSAWWLMMASHDAVTVMRALLLLLVFFTHATCRLPFTFTIATVITTWWEPRARPISAPKCSTRDGGPGNMVWVCRKIRNPPNFTFYLFTPKMLPFSRRRVLGTSTKCEVHKYKLVSYVVRI